MARWLGVRLARPRVPVRRSQDVAWLITGPLFVIALVLTLPVILGRLKQHEPVFGNLVLGLILFAMFVVAEAAHLHVEVRRQVYIMSPVEIPMLLALFYLPPLTVVAVRVLANAVIQVALRRGLVKGSFNFAAVSAGIALANLIVFTWRPLPDTAPRTWLVLVVAVLANVALTGLAVGGVITLVQGRSYLRQVGKAVVLSMAVNAVTLNVGLIMLLALQQSNWAIPILIGLAIVIVIVYRAYAQFQRQHNSLTELYDLTRAMTATGYDGTQPDVLLSARVDYPGLLDSAATPDPLRRMAMDTGETVAACPKLGTEDLRDLLRLNGIKDAIVVPLRSGAAVIGTLEAAGRLGDNNYFGADDVRLLETLAAHAAFAVENSRLVDRLRFDANHDALTGLPNRRRLHAAIEESVAVLAPGEVVAILLFDVVGLRDVNDSLGHAAGDQVLIEVARRLRSLAPSAALVARVGGDEFAVILRTPTSESALTLAEEIRAAMQEPMVLGTLTVDIDTTAGVAVHPDHGVEPATLLQRADVATHAAKSASSAAQLFNPGLESKSVRRLGLAADLRRTLDAGELEVYFQPKLALSDRRSVGVECLARWEHPVHGSVSPEDFVAVAEHTCQLAPLTETVLREGLRRARHWIDSGGPLSVAVNLSPRTLLDPTFPGLVGQLLEEYGVAAEWLTLEITEVGMVGDASRPLPTLRRLRDLGVRLAVDDFGIGYSSLAYLRRLPVHEVKVDRTFVQGMATDPGDLAIVRAIVDLSRH